LTKLQKELESANNDRLKLEEEYRKRLDVALSEERMKYEKMSSDKKRLED
jgi:hypothetical protein